MSTFGFFSDAGLTVPVATLRHYNTQGDRLLYFGSPAVGQQLQDNAAPGSTNVQVTLADSAGGTGLATSAVKLAATNGGLAGATGGAALSLGATVLSGTANAKPVHIRINTTGLADGEYVDVSLNVNAVREDPV